MATVNRSARTSWDTLAQWAQSQPDKPAYKCVKDVEALREWQEGTDIASRTWQLLTIFQSRAPLNTENQKFAEFKRMLLTYLETAPSGNSFSIEQLKGIQKQIEANETLAEMWNCTKKEYFLLARKGRVRKDFPDYVFDFTYFGTLAERVTKIKAQIHELNHPRSQAFVSTTHWYLRNTSLTHAFVPQVITNEFTHITFLDMSNNQFETVGDLSALDKLETLLLTNNRLRKITAAHLPLSLEGLALDNNHLEAQPNLARFTQLKSLDLSDNRLAAISSRSLPSSLTSLDIRRNPLDSIEDVQTAFPDLEIESDTTHLAKKRKKPLRTN